MHLVVDICPVRVITFVQIKIHRFGCEVPWSYYISVGVSTLPLERGLLLYYPPLSSPPVSQLVIANPID